MQKLISLIVFLSLVFIILLIGGYATGLSPHGWVQRLSSAFWGEPSWLVPPSWLLVYGLVAISGWLVWIYSDPYERIFPMMAYTVQLLLNASWWWIYFAFEKPMLALMVMTLLSCLILFNIIVFWFYQKFASFLLLPYFAWVVYATALNWALFIHGK